MNIFEQVEAMHQQVREFVEKQEPECKVISVSGYTDTKYVCPLDKIDEIHPAYVEYTLSEVKVRFLVNAWYLAKRIQLDSEVCIMSDGSLQFASPQRLSMTTIKK